MRATPPETRPDPSLPPALGASGDGAGEAPLDAAAAAANERTRDRLWWAAGAVYRRRWVVVAVTVLVAALSVYLTLQIPNKYRAETRVLLPDEGGGLMASALSSISPAAAALLGGGAGGFTRYMAILTSPSTLAEVVDRFDLVGAYDLGEREYPRQAAIGELYERASFEVSLDYDYLAVSVLDEDPERAAQMANHFVELLNERNVELTTSSAASNRAFLEGRLERANADLDAAQAEMQALQERSGVIEPTAQAEALFASLAEAQGQVAVAEAGYQGLLAQLGPDNPEVQSARAVVESARAQVARLRGGAEGAMPIAIGEIPGVQRRYADVMQDLVIQRQIIETIQPLYEQAALQEQREADAVQVLDPATPPTRKAEPRRSLLVIAATLSAFLVAVAVALLLAALRRGGPSVLARLRAEA